MTNALIMPSTYVEVKDEEVEYLEGGAWWIVVGWICQVCSWGLGIASAICGYNGNAEASLGLGIAATVFNAAGAILTGIKTK